jgi:hypothetical protein
LHLSGNLHGEVTGVEASDTTNPAFSGKYSVCETLIADAIRADCAHSGNHHAFLQAVTLDRVEGFVDLIGRVSDYRSGTK